MSERSVATWGPLPSLCVLGMLYTITRYRDTTQFSSDAERHVYASQVRWMVQCGGGGLVARPARGDGPRESPGRSWGDSGHQRLGRYRPGDPLEGARGPNESPDLDDPPPGLPPGDPARARLLAKAARASDDGNNVRAAILRQRAAGGGAAAEAKRLRRAARRELHQLVGRLQEALGFPAGGAPALLPHVDM